MSRRAFDHDANRVSGHFRQCPLPAGQDPLPGRAGASIGPYLHCVRSGCPPGLPNLPYRPTPATSFTMYGGLMYTVHWAPPFAISRRQAPNPALIEQEKNAPSTRCNRSVLEDRLRAILWYGLVRVLISSCLPDWPAIDSLDRDGQSHSAGIPRRE